MNISIWPIDRTLPGTTTLLQSNLGVMAIRRYSTFPESPALAPHDQIHFSVIHKTLVGGALLLCRRSIGVFYGQIQEVELICILSLELKDVFFLICLSTSMVKESLTLEVANVLNCDIIVHESEIESRSFIPFLTNIIRKNIILRIPSPIG